MDQLNDVQTSLDQLSVLIHVILDVSSPTDIPAVVGESWDEGLGGKVYTYDVIAKLQSFLALVDRTLKRITRV